VLLVGSKALQTYMPLGRIIHDWDLWMSEFEYNQFLETHKEYLVKETPGSSLFDIYGTIAEIKRESQFATTDWIIWNESLFSSKYVETPFGKARVPDIQIIYDMKAATYQCIPEWKHKYDKELIEKRYPISADTKLYRDRLAETYRRVEESKKNKHSFFHRSSYQEEKIATIPEYIVHDKLHEMIADLIGKPIPTYVRMIKGDVEINVEAFRNLTYAQKIDLMVEESLVLALERWFIPQMVENGINYKLIPKFYSNNEASPSYLLLKHVNIKGLKGEHPEIVQFGRDNFAEIEKKWIWCKDQIRGNGGFPQHFYNELFDLREKYRKGEKVGIHHGF
jgi:hypothetical protein